MPVIPIHQPILARDEGISAQERDATKRHSYSVIAGITIVVLVLIVLTRLLWRKFVQPRILKRQMEKRAIRLRTAQRESWYKSNRPVDRRPTFPHVGRHREFHLPQAEVNCTRAAITTARKQDTTDMPRAGPVSTRSHRTDVVARSIKPTMNASNASEASIDSSSSRPRSISEVSGAHQPILLDLEPFSAFNPRYDPAMNAEGDIGDQSLRDSHSTMSSWYSDTSVGVAIPVKLARLGSPATVHTSPPVEGLASAGIVGVAVPLKVPKSSSPTEVHISSRSPSSACEVTGEVFVVGEDDHDDLRI